MERITIAPPLSAGFIRISWLWVLKNFFIVLLGYLGGECVYIGRHLLFPVQEVSILS